MKKCRFYMSDLDARFIAQTRSVVSHCADIEIVGSSGNGRTALSDALRLKPDVVMTDISLPELDGITLLHELKRLRHAPAVIICTRFYSEACMHFAYKYGASFFLCKPIEIAALPDMILQCGQSIAPASCSTEDAYHESKEERMRGAIVHNLLKEMGMSARLDGTAYFTEAAVYCHGDALLLKNLSKGLYAQLAQRMDASVSRIERSMRSAIAIAYERGTLSQRFTHRPTNREFIEYLMRAVDHAMRSQIL